MKRIIIAGLCMAMAQGAQAMDVKNRTGEAQTITIKQGGASEQVTIPPYGRVTRTSDNITLIDKYGHAGPADKYDSLAIWDDGKITIQRRDSGRRNR